jgi:tetratricopeptide (TPR) repeat protein
MKRIGIAIAFLVVSSAALAAQLEAVGSIAFPTSGSAEAQEHFLRGVGILHSFGWKQAREEFQKAQAIEPDFAMAYWGESLCYNHPLISERDLDNPRQVLERLGSTPEARASKAPTDRERGFLAAVEALFFGEGDTAARRTAYMQSMQRLHERYPEDPEVSAFYALSLLSAAGSVNDRSLRMRVRAGAIAMDLLNANPNHPGAAHYIIHAFDDPVHAPLALAAAWKFAEIAPAVSHARHMPSHIFIQLGMWREVSRSNQSAYDAAVALWEPGDDVGDMVHALDWGQYGDLQLGDYAKAKEWIARMEAIAKKSAGQARVSDALPRVKARYVIETQQWVTQPVTDESHPAELLATGMSAIELGDSKLAERATERLGELVDEASSADGSYYAYSTRPLEIMHKEMQALVTLEKGKRDEAIALLEEGVAIEEAGTPPRGAANPIKPVHELLAETLLELGQPERAVVYFEKSLLRMPNRPQSVLGLARAKVKVGDAVAAAKQYRKLARIWEGRDVPALVEVNQHLETLATRDR